MSNSINSIINKIGIGLGTFSNNIKNPVHNWYKFTAGFSYKFVDEIISKENSSNKKDFNVFEPFAGCGTTLVSCQTLGVNSVGNESQRFLIDIIKAKLDWDIDINKLFNYLIFIKEYIESNRKDFDLEKVANPLLKSLYKYSNLKILYLIKDSLDNIKSDKYKLFFKLALSQSLHKLSVFPISSPYISRNKMNIVSHGSWDVFSSLVTAMYLDTTDLPKHQKSSKVYYHDSRKKNIYINDNYCDICITSPPYLNNLDYGEVSKVHTHFFNYTNNWSDITKYVRKKLVTGATTHYKNSDFILSDYKKSEFGENNKKVVNYLLDISQKIRQDRDIKKGKKSFDLLVLYYFRDMYDVLKEIRRIVKPNGKAFLIMGDSAPYGVSIPTTDIIGKISKNIGFSSYKKFEIRKRGLKWQNHKYRHNKVLSENILVLD
jgi:DNA modification methylase